MELWEVFWGASTELLQKVGTLLAAAFRMLCKVCTDVKQFVTALFPSAPTPGFMANSEEAESQYKAHQQRKRDGISTDIERIVVGTIPPVTLQDRIDRLVGNVSKPDNFQVADVHMDGVSLSVKEENALLFEQKAADAAKIHDEDDELLDQSNFEDQAAVNIDILSDLLKGFCGNQTDKVADHFKDVSDNTKSFLVTACSLAVPVAMFFNGYRDLKPGTVTEAVTKLGNAAKALRQFIKTFHHCQKL
jgi:hypothetical protein